MTDSTLTRPVRRATNSCSNVAATRVGRCGPAWEAVETPSSRLSMWLKPRGSDYELAGMQTFARRILLARPGMAA